MWESLSTIRKYFWRYRRGMAVGGLCLVLKDVAQSVQPLMIRGDQNTDADRDYYAKVIKPMLGEPNVEFIGEVDGREKDAFLSPHERIT